MASFMLVKTVRGAYPSTIRACALFKPVIPATSAGQKKLFHTSNVKALAGTMQNPVGENLPVYTGHWKAEKYLAIGLALTVPTAIIAPNNVIDYALVAGMVLHGHWGVQAIIGDYAHQGKKGRAATPFWTNLSIAVSAFAFASLCYFNYNDVGLTGAIRLLWTIT